MNCPHSHFSEEASNIPKKAVFKNNSSIEEITQHPLFWELLRLAKIHWLDTLGTRELDDFLDNWWWFKYSIQNEKIDTYEMDEIRRLKSSCNNQLCIPVHNEYADKIAEKSESQIPLSVRNENWTLDIQMTEVEDFVNLESDFFIETSDINIERVQRRKLEKKSNNLFRYVKNIKNVKIINTLRALTILDYNHIFEESVQLFFQNKIIPILEWEIEDLKDMRTVFLLLEKFTQCVDFKNFWKKINSLTSIIIYNSNRYLLHQYIRKILNEEHRIVSLTEIELFLQEQTTQNIIDSLCPIAAQLRSKWEYIFDGGVYKPDYSKDLKIMENKEKWGCPFVKWGHLAKSYEISNHNFSVLLNEFSHRWFLEA